MKVLFLTRSLGRGGAERQLVVLAKGLQRRGHEVYVAVFYAGGELEGELRDSQVPIVSLEKCGRWDIFGFLMRLVWTVRRLNPDVLHSYVSNLITIAVRPFSSSLKIVWGIRCSYVDFGRYDWLFRLSHTIACRVSRCADLIIANSHAGRRDHVADGYPEEKMIVIPNGIDSSRFCPNPSARERIRLEWGVSRDQELVGLVGRLDPMKDHETFLQAARLLVQTRNRVRFVCVGDGQPDYRRKLKELTSSLGLASHVMWVGARADMADIYNALDVLVNCSYGEGFSNVIGEAMASGISCVATDVGDSRHIIGDLGELVEPRNAKDLHNAIQRLLSQKQSPEAIRRRIVEKFSPEELTIATERELLRLCHQVTSNSLSSSQHTLTR